MKIDFNKNGITKKYLIFFICNFLLFILNMFFFSSLSYTLEHEISVKKNKHTL